MRRLSWAPRWECGASKRHPPSRLSSGRKLGHAPIRLTVDLSGRWLPMGDRAVVNRLDGGGGNRQVADSSGAAASSRKSARVSAAAGDNQFLVTQSHWRAASARTRATSSASRRRRMGREASRTAGARGRKRKRLNYNCQIISYAVLWLTKNKSCTYNS